MGGVRVREKARRWYLHGGFGSCSKEVYGGMEDKDFSHTAHDDLMGFSGAQSPWLRTAFPPQHILDSNSHQPMGSMERKDGSCNPTPGRLATPPWTESLPPSRFCWMTTTAPSSGRPEVLHPAVRMDSERLVPGFQDLNYFELNG